jgi:hypothetical protein
VIGVNEWGTTQSRQLKDAATMAADYVACVADIDPAAVTVTLHRVAGT